MMKGDAPLAAETVRYDYAKVKPELDTKAGRAVRTAIRVAAVEFIDEAGAFEMGKAWDRSVKAVGAVDAWLALAALDEMVEDGLLVLLDSPRKWAQHRVYCAGPRLRHEAHD